MSETCQVCGKRLESKMDQFRGRHLSCNPRPRDQRGIERDPSEPVDHDYADDEPTR